jgi:hypothetical protein
MGHFKIDQTEMGSEDVKWTKLAQTPFRDDGHEPCGS